MIVAIDKTCINKITDTEKFDYIYIFENEPLKDLLKLNMHCIHKDYIEEVDVNLTKYNINARITTTIDDESWKDFKKPNYKFAIIIPSFNNDHGDYKGKTYLQNCIESILEQTYKEFEIVIVDDCSTDTSIKTIQSYKDKRIHLIQNRRKRYNGGSRNVGIDYALDNLDFDYFCFLDSDDWWKHDRVLAHINEKLYNEHMLVIGAEMLFKTGVEYQTYNTWETYKDFFMSIGKTTLWCTAWCRVIRKDKIVHFCEDTLMEDRVWSYRQADNIDYNKVINMKEICYVWNRMNNTQSVSQVRDEYWNASAYCHIGHQKQLLTQLKHKEMIPVIQKRIKECEKLISKGIYQQY